MVTWYERIKWMMWSARPHYYFMCGEWSATRGLLSWKGYKELVLPYLNELNRRG